MRRIPFVVFVNIHTIGAKITDIKRMNPAKERESFSAFFIAIFLGTSSPNIILKNESTRVITTTKTLSGITIPLPFINSRVLNQAVRSSAKLSAANADPKKPARVIAT